MPATKTQTDVAAYQWSDVPELIDRYTEKCAARAWDIRQALADVYTHGDVGVYLNPETDQTGLFYRGEKFAQDMTLVADAVERVVGKGTVDYLGPENISWHPWVKVAYSPMIRRSAELLNFLPGNYPGGLPNAPSPLAATLTSGLVGAGLGYGAGWLGEKLLPHQWKRGNLRRTLALLGAGTMALPGAAWMYSNHERGMGMLDGSEVKNAVRPASLETSPEPIPPHVTWNDIYPDQHPSTVDPKDVNDRIDAWNDKMGLGSMYKKAIDHFIKEAWGEETSETGATGGEGPSPYDVNINHLGQTLWEVGADPKTTATTMGTIYAAQQMPDEYARPGYATPQQTGLLGQMLGGGAKGYATGWLVGKTLGLLTGMPMGTQNMLKNTGAVLGIIDVVVPRLFGR